MWNSKRNGKIFQNYDWHNAAKKWKIKTNKEKMSKKHACKEIEIIVIMLSSKREKKTFHKFKKKKIII